MWGAGEEATLCAEGVRGSPKGGGHRGEEVTEGWMSARGGHRECVGGGGQQGEGGWRPQGGRGTRYLTLAEGY